MLKKLVINSIAIIDHAEIEFSSGLNIMSGETGAGKSVILESLNFVLGSKADKSFIRSGENACSVTAIFDVENNLEIQSVFTDLDMDIDDELIITRKLTVEGKSSIKVNGETVTVGMLRKFTSILVDVFGQSKHFWLLNVSNQLALIDDCGGEENAKIKAQLKDKYKQYKDVLSQLDELGGDESHRLMRLDVLNYQIDEIEKCDLKENEEQELLDLRTKINNREKIFCALNTLKESISGEGGVSDILSNSSRAYLPILNTSEEFTALFDRIQGLISEADDISSVADNILNGFDDIDFDPNYVESRLDLIKRIKKKYGNDYAEIMSFLDDAIKEKDRLENFNVLADKLLIEKVELEKSLYNLYLDLSKTRQKTAKSFAKNVQNELKELGMDKAEFTVQFDELAGADDCLFNSANGIDNMEFYFTANVGEPLKSLSSIISGGELSRFMLAIKAQTAKYNNVSTFIFDEIDSGISGNVARVVAEKFVKISLDAQVIAITHLPQISAMGDSNYLISKSVIDGKTISTVKQLNAEEKVNEVIRLVGGDESNVSARALANDLIQNANQFKLNNK
ncbi:MAG: DNA repair protein RecN [Clostridia bacterium]|nr:DNA repair protein RecN [Clostridia bacterium]